MKYSDEAEGTTQTYATRPHTHDYRSHPTGGFTVVSAVLVGYVVFWALRAIGVPVDNFWWRIRSRSKTMLAQVGNSHQVQRLRAAYGKTSVPRSALESVFIPLRSQAISSALGQSRILPGLGNWDNSCYQNSVIQGFASLKTVQRHLQEVEFCFDTIRQDSTNLVLLDMVHQLNDEHNHGKVLWMPATLKSMSSMQQQDAQEYFSKILEETEKELYPLSETKFKSTGLDSLEALSIQGVRCTNHESYRLQSPFGGFLAQRVACTRCNFSEGLSMIPFNCLTVSLGRGWEYDVRDCLDGYTDLEAIEGVECAKCTLLKTKAQLMSILQGNKSSHAHENAFMASVKSRLQTVQEALDEGDFSDSTIISTCQIPKKNWATTTKSRQAVIAKPPKVLAIHINRSVFDEMTGAQFKNPAAVSFPSLLDLRHWCLGSLINSDLEGMQSSACETWPMDAKQSLLAGDTVNQSEPLPSYELRAVITHYGRHENGHYICYRKSLLPDTSKTYDAEKESWWRLSDEDVSSVSESQVLGQNGVFMLFYEMLDTPRSTNESSILQLAQSVTLPPESEEHRDLCALPEVIPGSGDDQADGVIVRHDLNEHIQVAGAKLAKDKTDSSHNLNELLLPRKQQYTSIIPKNGEFASTSTTNLPVTASRLISKDGNA